MTNQNTFIEVRSKSNDNAVAKIAIAEIGGDSVNIISAGFEKFCLMFKMDRMEADNRFYITRS